MEPSYVPPVEPAHMPPVEQDVICQQPEIVSGAPVFPGTRVPVRFLQDVIVDEIMAGEGAAEEFQRNWPRVTKEQLAAVVELAFARTIGPRNDEDIIR